MYFFPKMNDMSSGDDMFLSAYMDGELDSDQQHGVESALVASHELAENLRALTTVRELVAGLNREVCMDISPEVMRRIRGRHQSRSRLSPMRAWAVPTRRVAAVAGIFVLAACIMLIVSVVIVPRPRDHGLHAAPRNTIDNVIANSGPDVDTVSANELGTPIAIDPGLSSSRAGTIHSASLDPRPLGVLHEDGGARASDGHAAPGDLELARRMLDNPAERRFFLIKNGADGKAQQQVASVVERTTRFGYFKITVSQGIVIDPRHPDQATVFALLVNPKDLGRLRDQLKAVVPDVMDGTPADPAIVTQLADIGHVQEFAPSAPADVLISREALALRTRAGGADNGPPHALAAGEKAAALVPTPEQEFSAPVAARSRSGSRFEHNTVVPAAGGVSRGADASKSTRSQLSDPISEAHALPSRTEQVAIGSDVAKSDEMILVFVWVCQSRPS
jgi:anti-sigma factor RsiW